MELQLVSAKPLVLDASKSVISTLDSGAACMEVMSGKSVYATFRLPESGSEYLVSVTSTPLGRGLFSPRLELIDAGGKVVREVAREAFVFHGSSLYVGLRIHPEERYLVVASEPNSVGQEVSHIVGATQVATTAANGFFFQVHTGSEVTNSFVYAFNGTLIVAAQPIPMAK